MTDDLEMIKRRIKKLLALSKSPNENEAVSALEKARALMTEYSLSERECIYTKTFVKATKRLSKWRVILASSAAYINYCEHVRNPINGTILFYGDEIDVFIAAQMYLYLSKTIERMTKRNIRANAKTAYRDKYKLGIACRLNDRIQALGEKASWGPEHKARRLAVKAAMEREICPVINELKVTGTGNGAFQRGMRDGIGISLNRQTTWQNGNYLEGKK